MTAKTIKLEAVLSFLLTVLVFGVVVIRAYNLSPTQDEVFSFFNYAAGNWSNIASINNANNHLLNTLLGKLCMRLFGNYMFAFRLPNILSFILYAWTAYKISQIKTSINQTILYSIFLLCFPIIDYFSVARGYGLSFAFLIGSLYYCWISLRTDNYNYFIVGLFFSTLAIFSTLNLIYIHFILIAIYYLNLSLFQKQKSGLWFKALPFVIFGCLALFMAFKLQNSAALYLGDKDSLVGTTLNSVLTMFTVPSPLLTFCIGIGGISILLIPLNDFLEKRVKFSSLFLIIVFTTNILALVFASILLDINYPHQRAALYLLLIFLVLISTFNSKVKYLNTTHNLVLAIVFITLVCDFVMSISYSESDNHYHIVFPEQEYQMATKVGGSILFGDIDYSHALRYYNHKYETDFCIVDQPEMLKHCDYDLNGKMILKNKNSVGVPVVGNNAKISLVENEYINLLAYTFKESGDYMLKLKFDVLALSQPNLILCINRNDNLGNNLDFRSHHLDRLKFSQMHKGEISLPFAAYQDEILNIYVFNPSKSMVNQMTYEFDIVHLNRNSK